MAIMVLLTVCGNIIEKLYFAKKMKVVTVSSTHTLLYCTYSMPSLLTSEKSHQWRVCGPFLDNLVNYVLYNNR